MTVLILGREREVVDNVVSAVRDRGHSAVGVTRDDDALTQLDTVAIDLFIIGGGIEKSSRPALRSKASATGANVLEKPLRGIPVDRYVDHEILPRLRA